MLAVLNLAGQPGFWDVKVSMPAAMAPVFLFSLIGQAGAAVNAAGSYHLIYELNYHLVLI